MTDPTFASAGDLPTHYDRALGPVIFEHMASVMAERVAAAAHRDILEIAAGTGLVTRHILRRMPGGAHLTATDLSQPMLDVASAKFTGSDPVTFRTADAQDLPFDDASFDTVTCQFGHMFFPDRARAYAEARRVLKPGGRYQFSTWGTTAENPYAEVINQTFADRFQGDPPGFMHVPFTLNDPAMLLAEVAQAGFENAVHRVAEHAAPVADFDAYATGVMLGSPAFFEVTERGGDHAALARDLADRLRARFGPEPARLPLKAHFFEMTVP